MACDKCKRDVPQSNDATELEAIMTSNPLVILGHKPRHLLPVFEGDQMVCNGSPSRAQYLEGQPRDTRGYKYDAKLEFEFRAAYAQMQDVPDPLNEVPDRAIHNMYKN